MLLENVKFLIDVNLPYRFALWHSEEFIHQFDLGDEWTDEQIWELAKANDLTIITKDKDFSSKICLRLPPPKVIHIRAGNLRLNEFYKLINTVWPKIIELNKEYKLVNVYKDRIEGIN